MKTFQEFLDLTEIDRISPSEFPGGKVQLDISNHKFRDAIDQHGQKIRPLPTHPGYGYLITGTQTTRLTCYLFDLQPQQHGFQDTTQRYTNTQRAHKDFTPLIGQLSTVHYGTLYTDSDAFAAMHRKNRLTVYQINDVTIDEQPVYRNKGLGLAMYLLLLHLPAVALMAGISQTPAGRKQWIALAAHPAVQVDGMFSISDKAFDTDTRPGDDSYTDTLFGTLGVDYLGYTRFSGLNPYRFFTFPVMSSELANPTKKIKELMAAQKHAWTRIYGSSFSPATLIARLKDAR